MKINELLRSGGNVTLNVSLEDLRAILNEIVGNAR